MNRLITSVLFLLAPVSCSYESQVRTRNPEESGVQVSDPAISPEVIFVYRVDEELRFNVGEEELDVESLQWYLQSVFDEGVEREFELVLHSSVTETSIVVPENDERAIRYGDYTISFGFKRSHVAGCISRVAWNVAFRVNYQSLQLTDVHVAAWLSEGRVCMGYYQSVVPRFSYCDCTPTRREIAREIATALVGAGIAYGVSVVLADIMSYVAVGALAVVGPVPP